MDNFRKFKSSRGPASVDGVVGGRANSRPLPRKPATPAAPAQPTKVYLDSFRKTEGFRPAVQPKLETPFARPAERQPKRSPSTALPLELPKSSAPSKKKGRKQRPKLRRALQGVGILAIILVMVTGFIFGKAFIKARNVFRGGGNAAALEANVDPSKLNGEGDGRVNILLLGKGGDGHEAPDLTDTLLVASIDPVQNEMSLLSIPRDLYVTTDEGSTSKINSVYANAKYKVLAGKKTGSIQKDAEKAGLEAIDNMVADKMGIPIHYHVVVDFQAFAQAVDAVGGVDINITKDNAVTDQMYDEARHKPYLLDVKEGQQHFDGTRALFYSRSRHTSARGDFDRSQRQRLIIIALKEKILTLGTFSNPNKISQLLSAFGDHVQTNLTLGEMLRIYQIGKNIPSDKIASLSFVDPPNVLVKTDTINGQSVVIPIAGLGDFSQIQSFVRNSLKDAFLKKESANIAVFNGTSTVGLAGKKADELKSFGYNVTIVANANTKDYQKNVLVDLTNGQKKYTKSYLEKRLNTTAVTTVPDSTLNVAGADFVIIVGADDSTAQ